VLTCRCSRVACPTPSGRPRGHCDVACGEDDDCRPLGAHRCADGFCRLGSDEPESEPVVPDVTDVTDITDVETSPEPAGASVRSVCADGPVLTESHLSSPNGWSAQTQADVDALEGCEEIPVDLRLLGGDLDLRPLHALKVVGGTIDVAGQPSLAGLEQLTTVGGLWIRGTGVTSLAELGAVTDLSNLGVSDCPNLVSLSGPSLSANMESVSVHDNATLTDLGELAQIESVGRMDIFGNAALERVEFAALRSAGTAATDDDDGVEIALNFALRDINLGALESASFVGIQRNESLLSVNLNSLSSVQHLLIGLNRSLAAEGIAFDLDVPVEHLRVGGNGPDAPVLNLFSPLESQPPVSEIDEVFLNPCPWVGDATCDACYTDFGLNSELGVPCREELCALDDDCVPPPPSE
jgi:hypothetical protein